MEVKTLKNKKPKNKIMRKTTFVQGAFIATFGIVFTKILGILYVIPFHSIIGEQGGALYGYAYTIYLVFTALSSAGIPLAISKIISEYQTLGYYNAKKKAFLIGRKIALWLGLICFIILFIFAPTIAHAILGELNGGNTIEQVTSVIRIISTAILVVPILSIYRGYLEGNKYITPTAISQVLEQIVRVFLIIFGSFFALKVFNLSLTTAVGIAVFGATAGAFVSYLYLVNKTRKYKNRIDKKVLKVKEPKITSKEIFTKILIYAFPFIMIDIFKSLYSFIDTFTVVKTLGEVLKYSTQDAEIIMGILSTWATKFNMIIVSISTGIIVSLIPNLTTSFVLKDQKDVHHKINQTLQILLFLTIPMTVGLSFLAKPVWMIFYGNSKYGSLIFQYYIFVALIMSLFTVSVSIVQTLKYYKIVFISLLTGVVLKALLNTPLMIGLHNINLEAYYGPTLATIIGYGVSFIICIIALKHKCHIKYKETLKQTLNIIAGTLLMLVGLNLVKFIIPIQSTSRILNLPIIIIYSIIGMIIYFLYAWKFNMFEDIFGEKMINKILRRKVK